MGVTLRFAKRFKMKAALLLVVFVSFTFAGATNIKKAGKGRQSRASPDCTQMDTWWQGGNYKIIKTARSSSQCGAACQTLTECGAWSYYDPKPYDDSMGYDPYDCILKYSEFAAEPKRGFVSGKKGCY